MVLFCKFGYVYCFVVVEDDEWDTFLCDDFELLLYLFIENFLIFHIRCIIQMHWPYGEKTSCLGGVVYTEKDARRSMNGTYLWCGAAQTLLKLRF
jgi:hypothetical protein